jgi:hypothetical protein
MRIRLALLASGLLIAGPAFADPPKSSSSPARQHKPSPVILASADTSSPPSPGAPQSNPAPAKHRAGRVTACRCGDPQPETEGPDR